MDRLYKQLKNANTPEEQKRIMELMNAYIEVNNPNNGMIRLWTQFKERVDNWSRAVEAHRIAMIAGGPANVRRTRNQMNQLSSNLENLERAMNLRQRALASQERRKQARPVENRTPSLKGITWHSWNSGALSGMTPTQLASLSRLTGVNMTRLHPNTNKHRKAAKTIQAAWLRKHPRPN